MTATNNAADLSALDALRLFRKALYPGVDEARALIREAGVEDAQRRLAEALDGLEAAQRSHREAVAEQQAAQADLDSCLLDAEWALDSRFVVESNKHWLVTPCEWYSTGGEGECPTCGGKGERKPMTADDRAKWKAAEARKSPGVAEAAERVRKLTDAALDARDAITRAELRIRACNHELDASVAVLGCLTAGLAAKGAAA